MDLREVTRKYLSRKVDPNDPLYGPGRIFEGQRRPGSYNWAWAIGAIAAGGLALVTMFGLTDDDERSAARTPGQDEDSVSPFTAGPRQAYETDNTGSH